MSQRTAYRAGSLAQDRIDRLNSIGFKWSLVERGPEVPWETRFNELVKYKAKHGDSDVPQRQGQLGTWVHTQRDVYKAGSLAQDRIDRLDSIDFEWALKEAVSTVPWATRFKELLQFKTKHGDCKVPDGQGKLGNWVRKQRGAYKAGSLAQDRIDRLNSIGFLWALVQIGPSALGDPIQRACPVQGKARRLQRSAA